MNHDLFRGQLVRLAAIDADEFAAMTMRASRDSEFFRLLDSFPCRPLTREATKKWIEKSLEEEKVFAFAIRTLEGDRLIGDIGLDGVRWTHGDTFVGIGIGEREFWGKGYGTDAMHVILRFAFTELNLHRVSLDVFEYNPRGMRSYEKCGFKVEGRMRGGLLRNGKRYDMVYMGILREEWEKL